jgi:micrococcal nuclease
MGLCCSVDELDVNDCTIENTKWLDFAGQSLKCKCLDIYDGDTITIAFVFHNEFYKIKCRLNGIDTPEIRTKNGSEKLKGFISRDWLKDRILNKTIYIKCGKFDKYGRLLGDFYYTKNDMNTNINCINAKMIELGLGYKYDGGKKEKV